MALELKPRSKWWYGRFRDGDKVRQIRLDVPIEGERPERVSGTGDKKFEASRRKAQVEFDKRIAEIRGNPLQERMVQRLAEIKTGKKIEFPKLADLGSLWLGIPRRRKPSERYVTRCLGVLKRFASFVEEHQPTAKEFVTVTPATARAFMDGETERGLSPKTWNDELKLLRTTFKHLHPQLTDGSNPFNGLVTKATEQVRRDPYSVEEMQFILQAVEKDPFIRPIIITGMCTAMRRGDCCLLSWEDVDLNDGFVTVKTSKTGETVDIPMFPMLRDLLTEAYMEAKAALPKRKRGRGPQPEPEGFVFPEQASMYQKSPDGITWRVKKVITEAFRMKAVAAGDIFPEGEPAEVRGKAYEYIDSLGAVAKAPRMRKTFDLYMTGLNIDEVAAQTCQKKPTVSHHLNEIEDSIELAFIRGKTRLTKKDAVQKGRGEGKGTRRASVRDFHSFRVTWITLALAAGVPLELVQRVTGHKTVEVVLKHYFRPGREDFKQRILAAMPRLLTGPADGKVIDVEAVEAPDKAALAALGEIAGILEGVTGKGNQARVEKALELLKTVTDSLTGKPEGARV